MNIGILILRYCVISEKMVATIGIETPRAGPLEFWGSGIGPAKVNSMRSARPEQLRVVEQ
jgi:hypothetical protein